MNTQHSPFTINTEQLDSSYESPPPSFSYAGFWLRILALGYDLLVIFSIMALVFSPLTPLIPLLEDIYEFPKVVRIQLSQFVFSFTFSVIYWLYFSLMESSPLMATLGKRIFGAIVTDLNGNRITFWRSSGRNLAKIVSDLSFGIGFLMAGFTPRKQALHDIIAGCLVVKKGAYRTRNIGYKIEG